MEFEKIQKVISEVLGVAMDEIKEDTTLTGDLGADSLDLFQILMGIEEEFSIHIDTDQIKKINTAGEMLAYLKKSK